MDNILFFEWDPEKDLANQKKHRVSFQEASETFLDKNGFVIEDNKHSCHEPRFYWVGSTPAGRILTTRFTWRNTKLRIIGSGEWRQYREMYHENAKKI